MVGWVATVLVCWLVGATVLCLFLYAVGEHERGSVDPTLEYSR